MKFGGKNEFYFLCEETMEAEPILREESSASLGYPPLVLNKNSTVEGPS